MSNEIRIYVAFSNRTLFVNSVSGSRRCNSAMHLGLHASLRDRRRSPAGADRHMMGSEVDAEQSACRCHQLNNRSTRPHSVLALSLDPEGHGTVTLTDRGARWSGLVPISRGAGFVAPVVVSAVHPHAMQDHRQTPCKRDLRASSPSALGNIHRPGFEREPLHDPCQDGVRSFEQGDSHQPVATLRDAPGHIDGSRLIGLRGHPEMGAHRLGARKPCRHIDSRPERQRHNWPYTWSCHQPPANRIPMRNAQDLLVECGFLFPEAMPDFEQWANDIPQESIVLYQFANADFEACSPGIADLQSEIAKGTPYLILYILPLVNNEFAAGEQHALFLTGLRLHMNGLVKPDPHHLGNPPGIVAVRLVDAGRQYRLHMTCLNADRREPRCRHTFMQVLGERRGFQPDPLTSHTNAVEPVDQRRNLGRHFALTDDRPGLIHHTYARLIQRYINPSEILHNCLLLVLTGSPFLPASYRSDSVRGRRSRRDVASDYPICLAAYNNGILHGAWIDAQQGVEAIKADIRKMLKASPIEGAEEYAVHDHEGFEGLSLSEYESIEQIVEKAEFIAEHGRLGAELTNYFGDPESARTALEDHYAGEFRSVAEFAEQITEETTEIPESLLFYIDYDRMARDLEINDILTIQLGHECVHIFWSH